MQKLWQLQQKPALRQTSQVNTDSVYTERDYLMHPEPCQVGGGYMKNIPTTGHVTSLTGKRKSAASALSEVKD